MVSLKLQCMERLCVSCGKAFIATSPDALRCKPTCQRGTRQPQPVRFVGVDGEGLGHAPDRYVLLGVGQEQVSNPNGLSWGECFEFLYEQFENNGRGYAYVGFFLGYDFTQIFKSLPEDRARMLLTKEGRALRAHRVAGKEPHPVECRDERGQVWQFDILGNKRLRLRPKLCSCEFPTCKCKPKKPWMFVCDVGGYWQTSFLNVINPAGWNKPVVTPEEYAIILEGKGKRSSAALDADMMRYNRLENAALERVMSTLDAGYHEIGVHLSPRQWFGPGQASSAWMKGRIEKTKEYIDDIPEWFSDSARKSYFGGWFEIQMHGHIPGITHEYDINSAYPYIISRLPCLQHGEYSRGFGKPEVTGNDICLVKARVFTTQPGRGREHSIGAMLHRNVDGSILRPCLTEGWYWWDELKAAQYAGCVSNKLPDHCYYEWVKYSPCDCTPPLVHVRDLYRKRLEVGKDSPLGKGAKLVYNSMYGKFAQSVGQPPFGNPIYASLITSGCRAMILRAIGSHPEGRDGVAMVATDAVFFLTPHPRLDIGNGLGQWSHEPRANLTLFKPGVYWDDKARADIRAGSKPKFKARGINAAEFAKSIGDIDAAFNDWSDSEGVSIKWPKVSFHTDFSMVTALQALVRGKWNTAGIAERDPITGEMGRDLEQSSDPSTKRSGLKRDHARGVWRSYAKWTLWDVELEDYACASYAYSKRFGLDDPFSEEYKQGMGETPDGLVIDIIKDAISPHG